VTDAGIRNACLAAQNVMGLLPDLSDVIGSVPPPEKVVRSSRAPVWSVPTKQFARSEWHDSCVVSAGRQRPTRGADEIEAELKVMTDRILTMIGGLTQ